MKSDTYSEVRPESEKLQPDVAFIQEHYENDKFLGYTWIVYVGSEARMNGHDFKTFQEAAEECSRETGAGPFPAPSIRGDTPIGSSPAFLAVSEWRKPEQDNQG